MGAFQKGIHGGRAGDFEDGDWAMFTTVLLSFVRNESGATAIEYGLIAALVSVASILALQALGGSLSSIFGVVGNKLSDVASQANGG
jgi:pilus assembly protein Flp/PilA